MSFSQALSGLRSQGENIRVISNNIANSQTVGFKGSRTAFADIFAGCTGCGAQAGLGVRVVDIQQDFSAGALENTGRGLDLAISGQGFFRMEKTNGEIVYSRNGQFNQDANGYLVNATGQFLTGFGLTDPADPFSALAAGGAPQRIQITQDALGPNATTQADAIYNLNSSTVVGQDLQTADILTDPTTPATTAPISYHYSSSFTAFDSLGNERIVTIYYEKTGNNTWEATVTLDGFKSGWNGTAIDFQLNFTSDGVLDATAITNNNNANGGVAAAPTVGTLADGQVGLTFTVADPVTATTYDLGGAATLAFDLDLAGTTQFNSGSIQNSLTQDGFAPGSLIGIEIEDDGTVMRIFSNEERRAAGQIVLANFINPEGLSPDGDNAWREARASGQPNIGVAGTGVLGTIEGQTLESSNVDLATELVNMIVSQRAYQANSTSISTQDELLQTIINL
jgi:flagellar hook protein FlgE